MFQMKKQHEFEHLLNILEMPVRWVDMDAYGHVNNARFFDAMTEARADYFGRFIRHFPHHQLILVDTHCNFKKPYFYPGTMIIKQFLEKKGHSSFELSYQFYEKNSGMEQLYAIGSAKMVCYHAELKTPVEMPWDFANEPH